MTEPHSHVNDGCDGTSNDSTWSSPLYRAGMDIEWLKAELAKPGRSQAACARYIGLGSSSQVNRIVKGERQIKEYEAQKIREYLTVTAQPGDRAKRVHNQAEPLTALVGVRFIQVLGKVEAGSWREVFPDAHAEVALPLPDAPLFAGEDVFALLVVGSSMNLKFQNGEHVICRRWNGGPLPAGKTVVVERTDRAGKVETTLKDLVATVGGFELWPRSNDPRYQEPLQFDPSDEREVRVIARVIYRVGAVD